MTATTSSRPARCVMVLGTTSGAGKSWLATARLPTHTRTRLARLCVASRVWPTLSSNISRQVSWPHLSTKS